MRGFVVLCLIVGSMALAEPSKLSRPQKYAAVKAHTILPDSLKFLVKEHGKSLFLGLELGMQVPASDVSSDLILQETRKITELLDRRRHFRDVVHQMGFVSGLLAVYANPSLGGGQTAQKGFQYYLNLKLGRFHFVFDGYDALASDEAELSRELASLAKYAARHRALLAERYAEVNGNINFPFDERSAVFGIGSIYFSNLARLSAHLWYHAWVRAHGDLTRTPFVKKQLNKKIAP